MAKIYIPIWMSKGSRFSTCCAVNTPTLDYGRKSVCAW